MVGCALIGKGYWGSILKRYIECSNFFSLKAVCDSKSNLDDVWNNSEVEAVVVATPIETHYEIVKAALLAGKHIFSEKPLALKTSQCKDLKRIAEEQGLVLHTDYVFTFSKALKTIQKDAISLLGLDMCVKHLGRFGRQDVYWLLASHMLSVLGMFCPLSELDFCFMDLVKNETGTIFFDGLVAGKIDVSLNYPYKEVEVVFYCENETIIYNPNNKLSLESVRYSKPEWTKQIPKVTNSFSFDESNNLEFAFESFQNCILGKEEPNIDLAVKITEILEKR